MDSESKLWIIKFLLTFLKKIAEYYTKITK